jgi:hypothetical protein
MPQPSLNGNAIQPSVYRDADGMVMIAEATARPHGALRYQCPMTGSLVLITDEATLGTLSHPLARLRCADCGEMHLVPRAAGANAEK